MTAPRTTAPRMTDAAVTPERAIRRLFLTLFLRGRTSRGLRRDQAPRSIGKKLLGTLALYTFMGLFVFVYVGKSLFAMTVYLNTTTFILVGLFVTGSAGEILFNDDEADILMHRPISAKALLWGKVRVIIDVALWLAGAVNLVGFIVAFWTTDHRVWFPLVHAASVVMLTMFCVSCVVVMYHLCFRWFGRERVQSLMTSSQVIGAIAMVAVLQLLPRLMIRSDISGRLDHPPWWIVFAPPAWFAGFDDAMAGSGSRGSWMMAAIAVVVTVVLTWAAFSQLAHHYGTGLQRLSERSSNAEKTHRSQRRISRIVSSPPLSWWLRDPVTRASFSLTVAYLLRDRDTKLRVYPGLAPVMIVPILMLLPGYGNASGSGSAGFRLAFISAYVSLIPMMGASLLQYSSQWQASDVFRVAPVQGPAALCRGSRAAILLGLTMPLMLLFVGISWLMSHDLTLLLLLIPGFLLAPIYALLPYIGGRAVPLSMPLEQAKAANRAVRFIGAMVVAMLVAGLSSVAWTTGWFWWLVGIEAILTTIIYVGFRYLLSRARWAPLG